MLIYPIDAHCRWAHALTRQHPLRALIGATRAAVLASVGSGTTAIKVAHSVGISPGSARRTRRGVQAWSQ